MALLRSPLPESATIVAGLIVQVFAAAVVKGAKNPEACKRLIEFLASEKATPTVEKTGMKRPLR
jgi:ABC-type Fe3+ transport system substrate-binding protein